MFNCENKAYKCNDVNNQQDATTFSLLIFLNQPYMFRATNSPILRSTFWLYTAFGTHRHCCRPVPRLSWGWANLSPETYTADLKRLTNEKVVASCWLFTSLYWWCTITQTTSSYTCVWRCVNLLHYERCQSPTCFGHLLWPSSGRCFNEGHVWPQKWHMCWRFTAIVM